MAGLTELEPGKLLTAGAVRLSLRNLFATRRFADLAVEAAPSGDRGGGRLRLHGGPAHRGVRTHEGDPGARPHPRRHRPRPRRPLGERSPGERRGLHPARAEGGGLLRAGRLDGRGRGHRRDGRRRPLRRASRSARGRRRAAVQRQPRASFGRRAPQTGEAEDGQALQAGGRARGRRAVRERAPQARLLAGRGSPRERGVRRRERVRLASLCGVRGAARRPPGDGRTGIRRPGTRGVAVAEGRASGRGRRREAAPRAQALVRGGGVREGLGEGHVRHAAQPGDRDLRDRQGRALARRARGRAGRGEPPAEPGRVGARDAAARGARGGSVRERRGLAGPRRPRLALPPRRLAGREDRSAGRDGREGRARARRDLRRRRRSPHGGGPHAGRGDAAASGEGPGPAPLHEARSALRGVDRQRRCGAPAVPLRRPGFRRREGRGDDPLLGPRASGERARRGDVRRHGRQAGRLRQDDRARQPADEVLRDRGPPRERGGSAVLPHEAPRHPAGPRGSGGLRPDRRLDVRDGPGDDVQERDRHGLGVAPLGPHVRGRRRVQPPEERLPERPALPSPVSRRHVQQPLRPRPRGGRRGADLEQRPPPHLHGPGPVSLRRQGPAVVRRLLDEGRARRRRTT